MWRFLTNCPPPNQKSSEQDLPNPANFSNAQEIHSVNKAVIATLTVQNKRKRSAEYANYSDEFRTKVARYALYHGSAAAIRNFSKDLVKPLSESTVRTWRDQLKVLEKSKLNSHIDSQLLKKQKGRPPLLGVDLTAKIKGYIYDLRRSGGIVNKSLVVAAAKGFVIHNNRYQLKEYGGSLELKPDWAEKLLCRMGFVRRKGTKAARKLPTDFQDIKNEFYSRISKKVSENNIPADLVFNWDQTGINIVPCGEWTLAQKGDKQVAIFGLEDKRQITVLFGVSLSGNLLPPQLLYTGKTSVCHPQYDFPVDWDIFHSANHWSNEETMLHYIDHVVVPYTEKMKKDLNLPPSQKALALFDVFAAHRCESVFEKLRQNNIEFVFVPASCTADLQPLDSEAGVNDVYKKLLKEEFTLWYGEQVAETLNRGEDVTKVDLKLSRMKPLHAKWLHSAFDVIKNHSTATKIGWEKTGIKTVVECALQRDNDEPEW